MSLKKGEIYRCPDANCGCEITVTKGAQRNQGDHNHLCCCGMQMELKS